MGNDSSRRKALLVLTHALAFALPFVSGVAFVRYDLKPRIADLNALIAKSYSGQVASFDVAAGDDRAAVAGLRRHMDRTTALRKGVVSVGGKGDYFLAAEDCMVLSEIAFLSDATERDLRVAEAARAVPDSALAALGVAWPSTDTGPCKHDLVPWTSSLVTNRTGIAEDDFAVEAAVTLTLLRQRGGSIPDGERQALEEAAARCPAILHMPCDDARFVGAVERRCSPPKRHASPRDAGSQDGSPGAD